LNTLFFVIVQSAVDRDIEERPKEN